MSAVLDYPVNLEELPCEKPFITREELLEQKNDGETVTSPSQADTTRPWERLGYDWDLIRAEIGSDSNRPG